MNTLLFVLATLTVLQAADNGDALPAGTSLLPEDALSAFAPRGRFPGNLKVERVPVEGRPFAEALRVETLRQEPGNTWDAQLQAAVGGPIAAGDVLVLSFSMRTLRAANEESSGTTAITLEERGSTADRPLYRAVVAGPEWRAFCYAGRVTRLRNPAEVAFFLNFRLNVAPQVIEIADVRLLNLGPDADISRLPFTRITYEGREPDAPWRREAEERIERHRKADMTIRVTDAEGRPVEGARVDVRMRRHSFLWGTAAGHILVPGDGDLGRLKAAERTRYRAQLLEWFNQVSPEWQLKESGWTDPDSPRARQAIAGLRWAQENHLPVYGHWLICAAGPAPGNPVYEGLQKAKDGDKEAFRQEFYNLVRGKVRAAKGLVRSWDITHPVAKWGRTRMEDVYDTQVYSDLIRIAREEAPGIPIYVNEATVLAGGRTGSYQRRAYPEFIRMLARQGTPADGICFQAHFGPVSLTPPADMYAIMDGFYREFQVPLRLSELDIDPGEDEELQADFLRDVLTVAFSHPAVEAITQWGFWEGWHWKPNRAIIRTDWTLKPAGRVYEDLVFNRWWTNAAGTSGADGMLRVRGFLGDYEVRAEHNGRRRTVQATLTPGGLELDIPLADR
ncbi:MAG: hypothetical protein GXY85_11465 [Candidatus Brocadiaceae bacterium]|nr:hypothetical protein [Candidatus Brocadiaceae bacterium]